MITKEIAAVFSLRVYDVGVEEVNRPLTPAPWTKLDNPLPVTDGFAYGVFRNDGTGEVVISYRGTDGAGGMMGWDGTNNIGLYAGFATSQAMQAAAVYAKVLQLYGSDASGSNISFTGHSLGGGLASVMSVWFDRPAIVFDPAPFQSTAENGAAVNFVIHSLGAFVPQAIRAYIPANDFSSREKGVQSYYAVGELLGLGRTDSNTVYGINLPVTFGNQNVGAFSMHSQALLAAGLLSDSFRKATIQVQTSLPLIMAEDFYSPEPKGLPSKNFLLDLIRSEQTNPGIGKLTHFANDLNKLGTNIAGLNTQAQDALIAQGIEWYYWQGTDYAGQEFFTQTGESLQYTTAMGAGLADAQNKAASHVGKWLTPIVKDHGEVYSTGFATHDQWNVVTGSSGTSLTALKSDKSQIFIGGAGGDSFTGCDLGDVMFAGAGNDTLSGDGGNDDLYGGAGNDTLKGGAGYDRYVIEGTDTIEDSDGIGNIRNKAGQRIAGAVEKRSDGSYVFLSDTTISVAGGADLTLTLADGSGVTIQNFQSGDLGLHLNDTATTPETSRTIVGELAPVDFNLAEAGVQTRLDNVIVDPNQPEANRRDYLYDSAGNDDIILGDLKTTSQTMDWSISRSITTDANGVTLYYSTYNNVSFSEPTDGGDDVIVAGAGVDWVQGEYGDDYIDGGADDDVLFGGEDSDDLFGGTGRCSRKNFSNDRRQWSKNLVAEVAYQGGAASCVV